MIALGHPKLVKEYGIAIKEDSIRAVFKKKKSLLFITAEVNVKQKCSLAKKEQSNKTEQ